jgi:cell division protein FtsB
MSESQWGCCVPDKAGKVTIENYIKCSKCKKKFHYECTSLDSSLLSVETRAIWRCHECMNKAPRSKKNDSTPIRNVAISRGNKRPALESPPASATGTRTISNDIQNIVDAMTKTMEENFTIMRQDMIGVLSETLKPIRTELSQINESLNFLSSQYEDMKTANDATKERVRELEKENTHLKSNVQDLNLRLALVEQQSRQCNIELQCVPEHKNENLMSITQELGKTIGCEINADTILNCTRTAKVNRTSTRPRSIVVQLASVKLRDRFLAAAITYNKANPRNRLNSTHVE